MKINKIGIAQSDTFDRFAYKSILPYFLVLGFYLLWITFALKGIRTDHILLITAATTLYFINSTGRKFLYSCTFLIVYWVVFDSVRLFPNYNFNPLHVGELYNAERWLFGIQTADGVITANEYFGKHNHIFLDIYTSIIYLCWIPVPFLFGIYLFITKRRVTTVHFWFAFMMVSQCGLIFQYMYPAAPPWYVEMYGLDSTFQVVPGNPGRLANFDKFFGLNLFTDLYSLNSNVYAAVPSLHCAFPVIQFFFAVKHKLKGWAIFYIFLMLSTWFSAVYTNHHYIIDVLCGIMTGALVAVIYSLLMKTRVKTFLDNIGKRAI